MDVPHGMGRVTDTRQASLTRVDLRSRRSTKTADATGKGAAAAGTPPRLLLVPAVDGKAPAVRVPRRRSHRRDQDGQPAPTLAALPVRFPIALLTSPFLASPPPTVTTGHAVLRCTSQRRCD